MKCIYVIVSMFMGYKSIEGSFNDKTSFSFPPDTLIFHTEKEINSVDRIKPFENHYFPWSFIKRKIYTSCASNDDELKFTESKNHYCIKINDIKLLLPKSSIGSPVASYRIDNTGLLHTYWTILLKNPHNTLTFILHSNKFSNEQRTDSFLEYLILLRDFINYSSESDLLDIKRQFMDFYISPLESDLKSDSFALNYFIEILEIHIDIYSHMFFRICLKD